MPGIKNVIFRIIAIGIDNKVVVWIVFWIVIGIVVEIVVEIDVRIVVCILAVLAAHDFE